MLKAIFTPTVFEILMSEVRSVLPPAQRGTRKERVKHKIAFLMTVLFNVFMRQTLTDDIWGKEM